MTITRPCGDESRLEVGADEFSLPTGWNLRELRTFTAPGVSEAVAGKLEGVRILLVEDDPLIALDLADMIRAAGAIVIGPVHTVARALALLNGTAIDAAILDYRLETETALPVADGLIQAGIPFLFHTSSPGEPERSYPTVPVLAKPTGRMQLVAAARGLIKGRQTR